MTRINIVYNNKCLCCSRCEEEMVKVGPMTFCNSCFTDEFNKSLTLDEMERISIDPKHDTYKLWLAVYKKKWKED